MSTEIWHIKDNALEIPLKKITKACHFKIGEGYIGKIAESKKPISIDVHELVDCPRVPIFKKMNIASVIAFPIMMHNEVIAVCEFLSYQKKESNKKTIETLCMLGEEIGSMLEHMEVEKQLEMIAHYDPVSELPNRAYFQENLDRILRKSMAQGKKMALIYLDLDDFKKINDSLGHLMGDKLLKKIASNIKKTVRNSDFIARIGGDEFAVLIEEFEDIEFCETIGNRIIQLFSEPFYIDGHEINSSVSIGIAIYPNGGDDASSIMKHADMAMYQSKQAGKNTLHYFSEELNQSYRRQTMIENHLRHAIEKNEFFLVYQPVISLDTGKVHGLEVLLRWRDSELGDISPVEFITIAEDAGFISDIGCWVFEEMCKQMHVWSKKIPSLETPLNLAVNISAMQLMKEKFYKTFKENIKKYSIEPNRITLEITETKLMKTISVTKQSLKQLSELGVGIAIDDFGTGYSSLNYLKHLPFTTLKIDKSFISDIVQNNTNSAIVQAIVQMSAVMDLKIVAEGIETQDQYDFLKKIGCHYGQGYYMCKPVQADEAFSYYVNGWNPIK